MQQLSQKKKAATWVVFAALWLHPLQHLRVLAAFMD
jgi:hypothetical protein